MKTTTKYDAVADRTLAVIRDKGRPVTIRAIVPPVAPALDPTASMYNPLTDTFGAAPAAAVPGTIPTLAGPLAEFTSVAVQIGLSPLTLAIDARPLSIELLAGASVTWAGVTYPVVASDAVAPQGTAMMWVATLGAAAAAGSLR